MVACLTVAVLKIDEGVCGEHELTPYGFRRNLLCSSLFEVEEGFKTTLQTVCDKRSSDSASLDSTCSIGDQIWCTPGVKFIEGQCRRQCPEPNCCYRNRRCIIDALVGVNADCIPCVSYILPPCP